ncbi:MAG TPA: phosphoesterase [Candidatus Angelobacter sp.]|nr:phosphoesterase [Candidatus Angelobacter sp.]
MSHSKNVRTLGAVALLIALSSLSAGAQEIKKVFVIALENHNWTQPANQFSGPIQQVFQNPNAPFINSLVNGTAVARIDGREVRISRHVAYATNYHNVLATPSGNNPHIHPSEPNYIWSQAGTNFGVLSDRDPFSASGATNQNTSQHLTTLLTNSGKTWRSYQEDIDLMTVAGQRIDAPLPQDQWTVPLTSFSGTFAPGSFNQFNGSNQFSYGAKHNPMVFFTDSNGGNDLTSANPLSTHYAPLQQLFTDLANDTVADYNWITPDQFNDMHTSLHGGFQGLTGDAANIRQGDNFLSQIIPVIMASKAYRNDGVIIIWFDEAEEDVLNDNPDDFNHTIGEIVISQRAHRNEHGVPFASTVELTHSSDLRTMEEIFHVRPFLGDAVNAHDLSSLFDEGAIPHRRDEDRDDRDRDDRDRDHHDHDRGDRDGDRDRDRN